MKTISLEEAMKRLGDYGQLCKIEPVVVTVNGVAEFQLAPLDEEDDLLNRLIAGSPEFQSLLQSRSGEDALSAEDAFGQL